MPLRGVVTHGASRGTERSPMLIQRSRSLSARTSCVITLCIACTVDTRHEAPGALHQPVVASHEPPMVDVTVDTSDQVSDEVSDGAAPGKAGAMPVLNQLLTTQALLVSLLLTPLAKAPPELPPVESEPAPFRVTRKEAAGRRDSPVNYLP